MFDYCSGGAGNIEDIGEVFERQQQRVLWQPLSSTWEVNLGKLNKSWQTQELRRR